MAQIVICYSRVDSAFVRHLVQRMQEAFPNHNYWYDESPHGLVGGDNWWAEILKAIANSSIFIYVLSNESVRSQYCRAEFVEALRLQKRIITIQARDKTKLTNELRDIQYIDMSNGVDDPKALQRLTAAINKQMLQAKKMRPLWHPATQKPAKEVRPTRPLDAPPVETPPLTSPKAERERPDMRRRNMWLYIAGIAPALAIAIPVGLFVLSRLPGGESGVTSATLAVLPSITPVSTTAVVTLVPATTIAPILLPATWTPPLLTRRFPRQPRRRARLLLSRQ